MSGNQHFFVRTQPTGHCLYSKKEETAKKGGEDNYEKKDKGLGGGEPQYGIAAKDKDEHRAWVIDKAEEKVGLSLRYKPFFVLAHNEGGARRISAQKTCQQKEAFFCDAGQTHIKQPDSDEERQEGGKQLGEPESSPIFASGNSYFRKEKKHTQKEDGTEYHKEPHCFS